MAVSRQRQEGKRVGKTSGRKNKPIDQNYSRMKRGEKGKRERNAEPKRAVPLAAARNWQLVTSAMILIGVIAIKLISPQSLEPVRGQLLRWMGNDTDFVAVFSAVGKAVGTEGGLMDTVKDTCAAVFGVEKAVETDTEAEARAVYSDENLPDRVCLEQKVLGFTYQKPVEAEISDRFGYRQHPIEGGQRFHYGVDLQADEGAVITAFADGQVTAVGESSVLGKYVTVQHSGTVESLYAHCSRIMASTGQQVRLGDPIAEVGQTGQATGAHLHFELMLDNTYLNPVYYVAE